MRERRDNLPRHLRHLTDAQLDVHPELQNYSRDAKPAASSTKTTNNTDSSSSSSSSSPTSAHASAGAAGDNSDGFGRSDSPPQLTAAQTAAAAQVIESKNQHPRFLSMFVAIIPSSQNHDVWMPCSRRARDIVVIDSAVDFDFQNCGFSNILFFFLQCTITPSHTISNCLDCARVRVCVLIRVRC